MRSGCVQDASGFGHLDHKCALASGQFIARSYTRKDAIGDSHLGLVGGHEASHLSHDRQQRRLPNVSAFAGHVGTSDHLNDLTLLHDHVVGNKGPLRFEDVEHGMS